MFAKATLWKHVKKCPFMRDVKEDSSSHRCQGKSSLLLPFSAEASEELRRHIMSGMNQNEVTAAVRTDDLIMKFGSRLHFKHGHLQHRFQYVRDRIRQLGRLLLEVRSKTSTMINLSDCLIPEMFADVVSSVRSICGFDDVSHLYKVPSLALKIGHSLKECTRIEMNSCLMKGSRAAERRKQYKEFLFLCDTEWGHEISSHALRSLHQRKFNKPLILPLAKDVKLLHNYLSNLAESLKRSLLEQVTASAWSDLCQVTLTQVVIFNRRRGGEVERMQLSAFTANSFKNVSEDIEGCLSEVERALCREFRLIYIEGKRGRKVPVLLTKAAQSQVNLLISKRGSVGIPVANKFLFARRNSFEPYRSSDCLRKYARESGATNPGAITSTRLRKHVATMSQMLALKDNELDLLASFLGHSIRVHEEFYRLPEQTLQVAKVSKVLIAMERGQLSNLQGRNLEDVDVYVPGLQKKFFKVSITLPCIYSMFKIVYVRVSNIEIIQRVTCVGNVFNF
jgi:hypothetical protein